MRFFLSRHLEQFVQIYDCGSIRAASDSLGLTQPALSKSLKQLEEELGVSLFERLKSGVHPTPFGHALRRRAQIVLKELEYASWEVSSLAGFATGHLRIGVGPVWSQRYFPKLLPALCQEYPNVSFQVETGSGSTFSKKLQDGEIDLYFGAQSGPVDDAAMRFFPIREFALSFYCRPDHPILQSGGRVCEARLSSYKWAGFSHQNEVAGLLDSFMSGVPGGHPGLTAQVEAIETLITIGLSTEFVIVATDNLRERFSAAGMVQVPLSRPPGVFQTGVMCRESFVHFHPVQFLLKESRRLIDGQLPET